MENESNYEKYIENLFINRKVKFKWETDPAITKSLQCAFDQLPELDKQILKLRYGLNGEKSFSLDEISKNLNISKSKIKNLESKALKSFKNLHQKYDPSDNWLQQWCDFELSKISSNSQAY